MTNRNDEDERMTHDVTVSEMIDSHSSFLLCSSSGESSRATLSLAEHTERRIRIGRWNIAMYTEAGA
jgi:hypothetical protein